MPPQTLDLDRKQQCISTISATSTFFSSPSIFIVVTIPSVYIASARIVDNKSQPRSKISNKDKGKEEDIDLDEDVIILN